MTNVRPPDKRKRTSVALTYSIGVLLLGVMIIQSVWNFPQYTPASATGVGDEKMTATALVRSDQSNREGEKMTTVQKLSQSDTFFPTLTELYSKYGSEIAAFRPEMREWCIKTKSCKFCDYEAEMMYMLMRDLKPQKVFEMAPNKGYSSHWILSALTKNDKTSRLFSFDIHDSSVRSMTDRFRQRWTFKKGDYAELLKTGELNMAGFDFIFIDALHEEEFSRGYCKNILEAHKEKATVAIHDIAADKFGGGRESAEVYKWMAFAANKVRSVFTMSRHVAPNMNFPMKDYVEKLNELRVKHGIIDPCTPNCDDSLHDVLYFKNGASPTLFFELNH
jgi:predicted O-methyltransferase YrrM